MKLYFSLVLYFCIFSLSAQEAILEVYTEDAYPLQYEEDGKIVGPATALIEKVLKEANINYEIIIQPWARVYNTALLQPNVLIYSLARTKEREDLFSWLGPIQKVNYALYGFEGIKLTATDSFETINNFSLAVGRNSAFHHYLANKNLTNIHLINNSEQSVRMLLANRVDLVTGSDLYFYEACQKQNLDCSQIKPIFPLKDLEVTLYLAASKKTDIEIIKRIQVAFDKIKSQAMSDPLLR
ncbi:transporter substrate-binding domain-containing protein [Colwellia sp. 4_MG-2023]|uniref:substrate-binding periplasmic protein n=1 Tax=unclassified Colwellia TaxID=196834 RepID=UPI001C0A64A1|nr:MULTISPECIES: transporter substrate-binding domain-containing protein [unclassified Colwellia]MBU2924984.1 transporter substrate-binding domain-containing protein [Colwellia sp. C2M11]MDO6506883.1 transporter substrate-binding domain-containing protein [Colwellia sp. 5_MG-2023]MDO6555742.1 transporter substrate-binding domain-containing protein [Colwellia sp. 4_MG-2023]MDO6652783.1 transporter substrate-binding domain-containing protein [Colwellia sp. 3_MG-2023]MDO6665786.1 transporter subs